MTPPSSTFRIQPLTLGPHDYVIAYTHTTPETGHHVTSRIYVSYLDLLELGVQVMQTVADHVKDN